MYIGSTAVHRAHPSGVRWEQRQAHRVALPRCQAVQQPQQHGWLQQEQVRSEVGQGELHPAALRPSPALLEQEEGVLLLQMKKGNTRTRRFQRAVR